MEEEPEPSSSLSWRIESLPKWGAVAFAARCALRVLPAFQLPPTTAAARRVTELNGAYACCLIAWHTAVTEGGRFADLGERAAAVLEAAPLEAAIQAKQVIIRAALSSTARDTVAALEHVVQGFGYYRGMAGGPPFENAVEEDVTLLETLNLGSPGQLGKPVGDSFFSRPLFGSIYPEGIPAEWGPVVDDWARTLEGVKLASIHRFYLRICKGGLVPQQELIDIITDWMKGNWYRFPEYARESPEPPQVSRATSNSTTVVLQGQVPYVAFDAESPVVELRTKQSGPEPAIPSTPSSPDTLLPDASRDSPPALAKRPDVWMLSDRPLERDFKDQDRFEFKDYANALATVLIHENTITPFTMAINAPWGAGKTTLANMIAEQLLQRPLDRGRPPHIICWFNAWMHDDAPHLATAFVSQVGRVADRHRRWWTRIVHPLPSAMLEPDRRRWRHIMALAVVVLLPLGGLLWVAEHLRHVEARTAHDAARVTSYQTTQNITTDGSGKETSRTVSETETRSRPTAPVAPEPPIDGADAILNWISPRVRLLDAFFTAVAGAVTLLLGLVARTLSSTTLGGFVQSPEKAAEAGTIWAARRQIRDLIRQATWRGNRFVVFVDDIERCKPPRSVDVLDAVNQLMDHERVVVVLLGDMSAVAAAAQMKYKDLAEIYVPSAGIAMTGPDSGKEAFGRLYLQKIVQFQFDLPIPPKSKLKEYMGQLVSPAAGGVSGGATT
jgi:hypothetical protein